MTPLRLSLPAPATGRVAALDELKGVAIILVVLYHAGGVLGWNNAFHGELGVDIFVILSGMGLALGAANLGTWRYLCRRFWRIYPAYWAALALFLAADACLRGTTFAASDIALHILGIHGWFGDAYAMGINDSFWYITLIVSLYLVYLPLRGLLGRPDRLLLAGALISFILAVVHLRANRPVGFAHLSLRLPGFFVGILAGRLMKEGHLEINLSGALGAALLVVFYAPFTQGFLFSPVWVACALMAAYAFLVRPVLPAAALGTLRYLGDRSLEIFLIHQPLIREYNVYVLQRYLPHVALTPWTLTAGMAAGLALALALSTGLHGLLGRLPYAGRAGGAPAPGAR
jgi:peptidoglycan/LPS O-acetylase OafA/YrhL